MKLCSKCKINKSAEEFSKESTRKDGLNPYCKKCCKDYRERNKEELLRKKKEYMKQPGVREHTREYKRKYYQENKERLTEQMRGYYEENRDLYLYSKARDRCAFRGIPFEIDLEDVVIPDGCPYLGIKLTLKLGEGQLESNASLDRIDPSKGYVKGNVQVISRKANTMKSNATREELIRFSLAVLNQENLEGTTLEKYIQALA